MRAIRNFYSLDSSIVIVLGDYLDSVLRKKGCVGVKINVGGDASRLLDRCIYFMPTLGSLTPIALGLLCVGTEIERKKKLCLSEPHRMAGSTFALRFPPVKG